MNKEGHQPTIEELKAKAYQPMQDAMKLHPFYSGKIQTMPRCRVRDLRILPSGTHPVLPNLARRSAITGIGIRSYQQVEYRCGGLGWHPGSRPGRHRTQGRHARYGRQSVAVQVSRWG